VAYIKSRRTLTGMTYHLVDVINGEPKTGKLLGVKSRKEADQYLYKYLGDKADNRPNSLLLEKVNFRSFVENTYLPIAKIHKTDKTYRADLEHLKHLYATWENCTLDKITADAISLFQIEAVNKKGLAKKTVNNRLALLSAILRCAYKKSIIIRMPEIKLFKLDKLPPRCFSDIEVNTILTKAEKQTDKTIYNFLVVFLNSGLRLTEMRCLKLSDIDLVAKQLIVNKSKNHKFRAIPINAD